MNPKQVSRIYKSADHFCKNIDNCCSKGCSYCCHQSIEILHWEIQPIFDYLNTSMPKKTLAIIERNVALWINYFQQNTTPKDILGFDDLFLDFHEIAGRDRFPCPFLINHQCSIYEARPLVCRMHIVDGSPDLCCENQLRDSITEAFQYKIDLLRQVTNQYDSYLVLFPVAIASFFGMSLPEKKIAATLLEL